MKAKKLFHRWGALFSFLVCFFIFGAAGKSFLLNLDPTLPGVDVKKEKAGEIVNKMIKAHGGMEKWLDAPSFSFIYIAHLFNLPVEGDRSYYDNWRYHQVIIEPRTSRGYVALPLENSARIVASDDTIWSQEYGENDKYKSSPLVVMYYQYSFLNLPWLTQMPGVNLEYLGNEVLPQNSKSCHAVKMTFSPLTGNNHPGYYILYIDPVSFLLKATKHTALFPILPGRVMELDIPVLHESYYRVFDNHTTSAGLQVPISYESYSADGEQLLSIHLIINPSFEEPFDEGMLQELEKTMVQF